MKILGIETSCDETAASLLEISSSKSQISGKFQVPSIRPEDLAELGRGGFRSRDLKFQILSNVVLSQIEIHKKYGGIVPEVAARQHVQAIIPVIEEALDKNCDTRPVPSKAEGYAIHDLSRPFGHELSGRGPKAEWTKPRDTQPDLIAVTIGPGLITSLQVGVQTAKTLAYVWNVPLIGINHLEAHLWSFLLNSELGIKPAKGGSLPDGGHGAYGGNKELGFPAIGLIISGGHTEMVLVKGIDKYQLIGRTRDDAVGEAFDKVAKLLNLGYPGGPIISHYAKEGDPTKIDFPRPMIESDDYDFSFSGIKTAVKYYLKDLVPTGQLSQALIKDICAGFQQAVIEVLTYKVIKAAQQFKAKSIILGGGVSANDALIKELGIRNPSLLLRTSKELGIDFYYPDKEYTGDNAAMVALAGFFHLPTLKLPPPPFCFAQWLWRTGRQTGQKEASSDNWRRLAAEPNLKII